MWHDLGFRERADVALLAKERELVRLGEELEKPVSSMSLKMHLMMVARASPFKIAYVPAAATRARSRASAASQWQHFAWQLREWRESAVIRT